MNETQIKFLITATALPLGILFFFGYIGWWGIIVAILISMFGLFSWRMAKIRSKRYQEEQVLQALTAALQKRQDTKQ